MSDRRDLVPDSLADPDSRPHVSCVMGRATPSSNAMTHGIEHELTLLVPTDDPIKLIQLRVRNAGSEPRQLSATYFVEWTLGDLQGCQRHASSSRSRPRNRVLFWPATRSASISPTAWRSLMSTGAPGQSPPTASSSWAGMARSRPPPPCTRSGCPDAQVPASIPAPPSRPGSTWVPAKRRRSSF